MGAPSQGLATTASPPALISNEWYPADHSGIVGALLVQATPYATPYMSPKGHTYQAIGSLGNVGGSAGAVVRFGLYADNNGAPGALISDFGTVVATTATPYLVTTPIILNGGVLYWLCIVGQGAPVTQPTVYVNNGRTSQQMGQVAGPVGGPAGYVGSASVSAALPAIFPSPVLSPGYSQPIVQVQA